MPGLSGVDLLRRLRELRLGIPVIVITVHGDVTLAVEVIKIGAVDFLGAALSNRERDVLEGASAGTPTADRL